MFVDDRSLYKYTNFLSVISLRIKKQLEEPFLPFSENIFTGSPSPAPYESYTKEKKKKNPHEDKGEKWLWYLIILYWSARVNCLKKKKLEKFSMFQ